MKIPQKQSGFAAIETALVIIILGMIAFTGWFVWHSKQVTDKTLSDTAKSSPGVIQAKKVTNFAECKKAPGSKILTSFPEQCVTKDGKTFTDDSQTMAYLTIKEWHVKLPLNEGDRGAYYVMSSESGMIQTVTIFDKSIDGLSNVKGVNCKDSTYPLLAISRIKPSDVAATQDINSPSYIGDSGPNNFKFFSFTQEYEFAAESSHQAAPRCEDINPGGDFKADPAIAANYSAITAALGKSYAQMQAE